MPWALFSGKNVWFERIRFLIYQPTTVNVEFVVSEFFESVQWDDK